MTRNDQPDPGAISAGLRAVLAAVESREMVATPLLRARIEGAVVALDLLAGSSVAEIVTRLSEADPPAP